MATQGGTPEVRSKADAAATPNAGIGSEDTNAAELIETLILPSSIKGKATHLSPLRNTPPSAKATSPPRLLVSAFNNDDDDDGDFQSIVTEDESTSLHTATQRLYIGGSHMDDSSVGTFSTYDRSTLGGSTIYEDAMSCVSSVDFPALKSTPAASALPPASAAAASTTDDASAPSKTSTAAPPPSSATDLPGETNAKSSGSKNEEVPAAPKLVISIGKKSPQKLALKETDLTAETTPIKQNMSSTFSATSLTTATTNTTDITHTQAHLSSVPEKTAITRQSFSSAPTITSSPARLHMPQSQSSVASSSIDNQTSIHEHDTITTISSVAAPPSPGGPKTNTKTSTTRQKPQQTPQNETQFNKKRSKSLLSIVKAKNKIKKSLLGSSSSKKQSSASPPSKRKQAGKGSRLSSDASVVSRGSTTPNKKKRTASTATTNSATNSNKKQSTQKPSSSESIVSSASTTSASISRKKSSRQQKLTQQKYNSTSNLLPAKSSSSSSPKSIDSPPRIKANSAVNLNIAPTASFDTDGTSKKSIIKKSTNDKDSGAKPSSLFIPSFSSTQPDATNNDVHESERRRKDQSNLERDTLQALWKLGIDDDDDHHNNGSKEEKQDGSTLENPTSLNDQPSKKKKGNSKRSSVGSSRPLPTDVPLSIQVSTSKESLTKADSKELDDDDINIILPPHLQSQRQQEQNQTDFDNVKYPQGQFSHASRAEIGNEGDNNHHNDDDKSVASHHSSSSLNLPPGSTVQDLKNQLLKERSDFKRQTKLNAMKHQQQMEEVMQSVNVVEKEYMSMIDDLHVLLQQKEESLNALAKQLNESKAIRTSLEEKEHQSKRKLAEMGLELERTRISSRDAQAKSDRVVERLEKQCEEKDAAIDRAVKSLKDEVARQFKEGDEMYEVLMGQYKKIEAERDELKNRLEEVKIDEGNLNREQTKNVMRIKAEFAMLKVATAQPNDTSTIENDLSIEVERDIVKKKNLELTKLCEELLGMVESIQTQT